jgi:hypothetical protein
VTGTNGKGSTAAMIASLLAGRGLRVSFSISRRRYLTVWTSCREALPAGWHGAAVVPVAFGCVDRRV